MTGVSSATEWGSWQERLKRASCRREQSKDNHLLVLAEILEDVHLPGPHPNRGTRGDIGLALFRVEARVPSPDPDDLVVLVKVPRRLPGRDIAHEEGRPARAVLRSENLKRSLSCRDSIAASSTATKCSNDPSGAWTSQSAAISAQSTVSPFGPASTSAARAAGMNDAHPSVTSERCPSSITTSAVPATTNWWISHVAEPNRVRSPPVRVVEYIARGEWRRARQGA